MSRVRFAHEKARLLACFQSLFLSLPLFFSLLFSLFREKWSPFFAVDRDPDQDHCQDDVKGVIL
ncbi:hypothetical protein, partial [Mesotoga prima]|uniref:hypothetical protein n=1 Tax=Mesotoga prima TaxID=1184387 RepID=UPI002BDA5F60